MWVADRIEKLVPYLRRYARAATGNTAMGDACVEAILQHVLDRSLEPEFEFENYDREGLFKLLDQELERVLDSRPAKARRALLLIAVEGFPDAVRAACSG